MNKMQIFVYILLAFLLQMARKCEAAPGQCTGGVIYHSICYIAVSDTINREEAVTECRRRSGYLTNFYSQSHMNVVMTYVRQKYKRQSKTFYTGLNYNPKTNRLTLRDGIPAPTGLKWQRNFPFDLPSYTGVGLRVNLDPSNVDQFLFNTPTNFKTNVLCEIP